MENGPYRTKSVPELGWVARYEDAVCGELKVWYRHHRWHWTAWLWAYWFICTHEFGLVKIKKGK